MNDLKVKKLLHSIQLVTTYAKRVMELDRTHNSSNKNVYWVFFDKNYNPYWLVMDENTYGSQYSYDIYKINKKRLGLDFKDRIAILDLEILKKISMLDYLEINNARFANKKIGSHLLDLFEYISYIKGAKKAKGTASAINPDIITQQKLNEFYKHKFYTVRKEKASNQYKLSKQFNPDRIKEYAKNFITIKKDNVIFKFQIPDYYKPIIAYELSIKQKPKTYPVEVVKTN